MIDKKTSDLDISSLEALVPLGLIGQGIDLADAEITAGGLCPLRISWSEKGISSLQPIETPSNSSLNFILPRFVETHAHIDKAFTWKNYPNLDGTYIGAFEANIKEHQCRTEQSVFFNAETSLKLSIRNGFRAIRTHIDSFGPFADFTWEVIAELQKKWAQFIHLQLVAMVPLDYWMTEEGKKMAKKVANKGGLLGGVLAPPFNSVHAKNCLRTLFNLANSLGCGIDLHIDESQSYPAAGLNQLINALDHIHLEVPITCSHLSNMSLLSDRSMNFFSDRLAHHQVNVVALPLTNAWLLGRVEAKTPLKRPMAPIAQLQRAGVNVAIGGDNVQDPWFPGGNFDPLSLIASSMPITQLRPWTRLGLAPFTTAAARLMNLEWDCTFEVGGSADFIVLEAENWSEVLSCSAQRKVIIRGSILEDQLFDCVSSK
ncbi:MULTISPECIES: amidohydrolase family protein [Prochlorococcus]|uniref:amidohydrolase family protein n=1 Tax=Prochlorococcus TaxID=1218 RepID=UPI000533A9FA|nr:MULTISPECIES: amidohydrolase family protein [Prochlorococcus]KGG11980.1 Cytosine deaminase [Prochlorococcus sp. MIT 0601]